MAKAKKAKKAKPGRRVKPRPKVGAVRKEMKRLSADLKVIIRDQRDQQGEVTGDKLEKAKKTKEGLDDALISVRCVQLQAPY